MFSSNTSRLHITTPSVSLFQYRHCARDLPLTQGIAGFCACGRSPRSQSGTAGTSQHLIGRPDQRRHCIAQLFIRLPVKDIRKNIVYQRHIIPKPRHTSALLLLGILPVCRLNFFLKVPLGALPHTQNTSSVPSLLLRYLIHVVSLR